MVATETPTVWRMRLMLLTGVAIFVLLVLWLRARAASTAVERRREAMVAALRGLAGAQDAHQARTGRYALGLDSLPGWRPPEGLVLTFDARDAGSWSATVHDSTLRVPPTTCGYYVGRPDASPHRAVVSPGAPACW